MTFSDNPGLERMMRQKPRGGRGGRTTPFAAQDSPCHGCCYGRGRRCVGICYQELMKGRRKKD